MRSFLRRTRVRLSLAYGGVLCLVTTVLAVGFWLSYAQLETARVDDSLAAQAQSLLSGVDNQGGTVTFQGGDTLPGETTEGIAIRAVLLDGNGQVLDRSGSGIQDQAMVQAAAAGLAKNPGKPQSMTLAGTRQRVLAQRVDLGSAGSGVLVLARPINELEASLALLALLLAVVVVVLVAVASAVGYWLAGRALRPVHVIASTARELSEQSLHRRIELEPPPDELGELITTLNGMLARLEAAFESLRRFTADAAHELRAPLTLLHTEAEVALSADRPAAEYRASLRSVLEEADRLSRTADQLLLLARADAGALAIRRETVDLTDLVEETVARWRELAATRRVKLAVEAPGVAVTLGDPDLLRRLLDNLIDNAIRHTPARGKVVVSVMASSGTTCEVVVTDSGPGVDPRIRDSIFERFTRADAARQRHTGGAGLGLALCAAIVSAHRGSIRVAAAKPKGARFVVELPGESATPRGPKSSDFIASSGASGNLGEESGLA